MPRPPKRIDPSIQPSLFEGLGTSDDLMPVRLVNGIPEAFWTVRDTIDPEKQPMRSDNQAKVAIFMRLFKGRFDVFAEIVPESLRFPKPRYQPACDNDRMPILCNKADISCKNCSNRKLTYLSDARVRQHLMGLRTLGVYALKPDNSCDFIAIDFDKDGWREDAKAFRKTCDMFDVPVAIEISRSGAGAHAWIFFNESVSGIRARKLGFSLLALTCDRLGDFKLASFDRIIPNQDEIKKDVDGTPLIGTLISLPLQLRLRPFGRTVFVDHDFVPYADQFDYLDSVQGMSLPDVERIIEAISLYLGGDEADFLFSKKHDKKSMVIEPRKYEHLPSKLPKSICLRVEDMIYIPRAMVPITIQSKLRRTACFSNNQYYMQKALGHSTWNIPRLIDCSMVTDDYIAVPRGCLDGIRAIFADYRVKVILNDQRFTGHLIDTPFQGELHAHQEPAYEALFAHDTGMLHGGTAFGKTVVAAKLIAERRTNTLVVVDSQLLHEQWMDALKHFLDEKAVGGYGAGYRLKDLTGTVDVALIQSLLAKRGEHIIENYGQIIVDECQRLGAPTYAGLINRSKARFVLGLSANDTRRDGHHLMMFMQCGMIRYSGEKPKSQQEVIVKLRRSSTSLMIKATEPRERKVEAHLMVDLLTHDEDRNQMIIAEDLSAYRMGRKIIILTARTAHRDLLGERLGQLLSNVFVLKPGTATKKSKREKDEQKAKMESLPFDTPRILVSTGKFGGTGFSHSPLDTMMLGTPISYIDDIKQYKGRIDRTIDPSRQPWIYDFLDVNVEKARVYFKSRKTAYHKLQYRLQDPLGEMDLFDQYERDPDLEYGD